MNYLRKIYHLFLAWLGFLFYRNPSRDLFVLGVTGTKGKSTVLELINYILEKAGHKTALLSSIRVKVGGESGENPTENTMPGRFFIQKFLRRAADAGCKFALIEVTSEGVKLGRHKFIGWDAAMFLNLHPEHIEAHGSFEKYREAKLDFFRYVSKQIPMPAGRQAKSNPRFHRGSSISSGLFFINKDDANSDYFKQVVHPELLSYRKATLPVISEISRQARNDGEIIFFSKSDLPSNLIGEFNKYNVGAAEAFARAVGVNEEMIKKVVAEFSGVLGRMEFIPAKEPFSVVIDYAHTPDSLREVYKTLMSLRASAKQSQEIATAPSALRDDKDDVIAKAKPEAISRHSEGSEESLESGRLICVLGSAGGGRDKWKRPEMGKIAAEYCDEIILTNEDPYDENPETILNQIEAGFSEFQISNFKFLKVLDRKEAIRMAISLAKPGDIVAITGKGSEKFIHIANGEKIPWSDKSVALDALK